MEGLLAGLVMIYFFVSLIMTFNWIVNLAEIIDKTKNITLGNLVCLIIFPASFILGLLILGIIILLGFLDRSGITEKIKNIWNKKII